MLTAYVDETGQEQGDWMFIAGYMGNDEAWKSLIEPWQRAIAPRKHLHMNRLRFSKEGERLMLERAARVPSSCGLVPIIAGVRQSDYEDLIVGTPAEKVISGYVLCCAALVIITLRNLPPGERLEIVFERQDRYGWIADIALELISKFRTDLELLLSDGTSKLANWRFVSKGDTILTEPADLLAYAYLQLSRDAESKKTKWCSPIFKAEDHEGGGFLLQRSMVRQLVKLGVLANLLDEAKRLIEARK
jgi:hypothetical protein